MNKILLISVFILIGLQNSKAQCFPNRHNTTWYESWTSCEESPNPNSSYGNSHWILYNLGYNYTLYQMTLWNLNETDNLDNGILNYNIDYSVDGNSWTNLGSFSANQASGLSTYEGEDGPNFGGITARYILLTPLSNYGGSCYGFSEIRFGIDESLSVNSEEIKDDFSAKLYPNPFTEEFEVITYNNIIGESIKYTVYDMLGRVVLEKMETETHKITKTKINMSNMQTGLYLVKITMRNKEETLKIIKN